MTDDDMYMWKQMSLKELEENLYALQIDYNPPLTEEQRDIVLQRLEAFISHVKSITPEELEEQTKDKWKAYRKELNTCCQDPVFATSQEDNLLFSNSQIVFLKDIVQGKVVYHCILRGAELDYAISSNLIPSIQKDLTEEQLSYLTNEKANNPYPKIEISNLIDEVKERIFKQVDEYVPPVYKKLLLKIEKDTEFIGYTHGSLYKFATDLSVEDYNLFLTDTSLNTQLSIIPGKSRAEYTKDTLQILYNDYVARGKHRRYEIMNMIVEFTSMLQEKWNYVQLFIKRGQNYYNTGRELMWKPAEIKYIMKRKKVIELSHSIVSTLGPKFNIKLSLDGFVVITLDIEDRRTGKLSYNMDGKKIYTETYPVPGMIIRKAYYKDGIIKSKEVLVDETRVKYEVYTEKHGLYLTINNTNGIERYTYYPVLKQMPLIITKSVENGVITKDIYYYDEEQSYLIERRIFNPDIREYSVTFYNMNGSMIPSTLAIRDDKTIQVEIQLPNISEIREYNTQGDLLTVSEYSDGLLARKLRYNKLGLLYKISTFEYGRLSQFEDIDVEEGTINKRTFTYRYNPDENVEIITMYLDSKSEIVHKNEEGNILRIYDLEDGTRVEEHYNLEGDLEKVVKNYPYGNQTTLYRPDGSKISVALINPDGSPHSEEFYREDGTLESAIRPNSSGLDWEYYDLEGRLSRKEGYSMRPQGSLVKSTVKYFRQDGSLEREEYYTSSGYMSRSIDIYPNNGKKNITYRPDGSISSVFHMNPEGTLHSNEIYRKDNTREKVYIHGPGTRVQEYYDLNGDILLYKEYYTMGPDRKFVKTKTEYLDSQGNIEKTETL